jgi:hypothetical protein
LANSRVSLSIDEVAHSLSLTEIKTTVRECAQSELAGISGARTKSQERVYDMEQEHGRAVTAQLDDLLARKRVRRFEVGNKRAIEYFVVVRIAKSLK